jgi:altronate dehydratase small subunit
MPISRAFKIHPSDNVATLLDDAAPGSLHILGEQTESVILQESIKLGHKVALTDIPTSGPLIKFGVKIGHASRNILAGQWVHLHNLASDFDQRSQTLDLHSGAATDTKYE